MPDVRQAHRAQHRIRDGMAEHVRVGMPRQPVAVRNGHATENQRPVRSKAVNVIADAGHGWKMLNLEHESRNGEEKDRPPENGCWGEDHESQISNLKSKMPDPTSI